MNARLLAIFAALASPVFTAALWAWILAHRAPHPGAAGSGAGGHFFPATFLVWLVCALTCGLLGTSVPKDERDVFSGGLRLFISVLIAAGLAMAFLTIAIR